MPKSSRQSGERMRREEAERKRKNEEVRRKVADAKDEKDRMLAERSVKLQEAEFHRQQRAIRGSNSTQRRTGELLGLG